MRVLLITCLLVILVGCNKMIYAYKSTPNALGTTSSEMADLRVNYVVDKSAPKSSDTIYYTLTVFNYGPLNSTNVRAKSGCPADSTFVGNSSFFGIYDSASSEWFVPTIPVGTSAVLVVGCQLQPSAIYKTIQNSVTNLTQDQMDPTTLGDLKTVGINVISEIADLKTTLTVNRTTAIEKQVLSYSLAILNSGPDAASDTKATFLCPSTSTYKDAVIPTGTTYNTTTGLWTLGVLANSAQKTLQVNCTVNVGSTTVSASVTNATSAAVDIVPIGDVLSSSSSIVAHCGGSFANTVTSYGAYGDGLTADTAFQIGNAQQLDDIAVSGSSDWDKRFVLCNDIDMATIAAPKAIGTTTTTPFTGIFDGNHKVLSNFNTPVGLIGVGKGFQAYDLTIRSSTLNCPATNCGFIVGHISGSVASTVRNIVVESTSAVKSSHQVVGSIVGRIETTVPVILSDLENNAPVTCTGYADSLQANSFAGGILGYLGTGGITGTNLLNNGAVKADGSYAGGIVGSMLPNAPSSLTNFTNTAEVFLTSSIQRVRAGGIIGSLEVQNGAGVVTISSSQNSGNVRSNSNSHHVAGLIGYLLGRNATNYVTITNSSVSSAVTITNNVSGSYYTGGFVGYFGQPGVNDKSRISNSTTSALVKGHSHTGGFVGRLDGATTIDGALSTGNVTAADNVGGFVGTMYETSQILNSTTQAASVTTTSSSVGGFVGSMVNNASGLASHLIDNCHVTGVQITTSSSYVGGFAGGMSENGKITNSTVVLNGLSSTGSQLGGFIGSVSGSNKTGARPTIENSSVTGTSVTIGSTSSSYVGGFAGYASAGGSLFNNSSTNINVIGSTYTGGFAGYFISNISDKLNALTITNSTSSGNVICSAGQCGGFIGQMENNVFISQSSSTGNVTSSSGASYHGGFVGYMVGISKISLSSSTGSVTSNAQSTGGFVGYLGHEAKVLDSSVVAASIEGFHYTGGFVGRLGCSSFGANAVDGICSLKRNFAKVNNLSSSGSHLGGFVGYLHNNGQNTDIQITDNFVKFTNLNYGPQSGGFIGLTQAYGSSPSTTDTIHVSRNFVATGTMKKKASAAMESVGGFLGVVNNSSLYGKNYFEDNYTNATHDSSSIPAGNPEAALGGFIGRHQTFDNTYYRRNYSNVSLIQGNGGFRAIGGFAGYVLASNAGFQQAVFEDNFSTATSITGAYTNADFFLGVTNAAPVISNSYYVSGATCTGPGVCNGSNGGTAATSPTLQSTPLASWDYTNVWQTRASAYPKLRCSPLGSTAFCTEWNAAQ
jgi:uncharacterized repeat protein (TIGR01451 family)